MTATASSFDGSRAAVEAATNFDKANGESKQDEKNQEWQRGKQKARHQLAVMEDEQPTNAEEMDPCSSPSPSPSPLPVPVPRDDVDYTSRGGPRLTFLWSKVPLVGQSLYLGGEVGCDGKIYCIPGHAPQVLVIDPFSDEVYPLIDGHSLEGKYKWLRGVTCGEVIYGLPCHADSVLRIHVPSSSVSTLPIPYDEFYRSSSSSSSSMSISMSMSSEFPGNSENETETNMETEMSTTADEQRRMLWKYHGGTMCPLDGCIYAIPQSAWHVLKIDPTTETCELVRHLPLRGKYKFYGGVVGKTDGAIYGIPHNSPSVLRIDPTPSSSQQKQQQQKQQKRPTQHQETKRGETAVTLHGKYGEGNHKWHGAAVAPDGTIVCVPANADTVLCIRPGRPEPTIFELGGGDEDGDDRCVIQTGRHRQDRKYKYLGAMTGDDGNVYCFPSGAEHVLQVDAAARRVRNIGPNLVDSQMERLRQNKWQNGLTSAQAQCTYAIPLAAESVLRIDTSSQNDDNDKHDNNRDPTVTTWKLPSPFEGLAKWEGATMAANGAIYCIPNNHKAVLKITSSCRGSRNDSASETPYLIAESNRRQCSHRKEKEEEKGQMKILVPSDIPNDTSGTDTTDDVVAFKYTTGIPTLRSSAHRVKHPPKLRAYDPNPSKRRGTESRDGNEGILPASVCREEILPYEEGAFPFRAAVIRLLRDKCDPAIVGDFAGRDGGTSHASHPQSERRLEDFRVPHQSLSRKSYGGCCEDAQAYLSGRIAADEDFLNLFDRFVTQHILPRMKKRLEEAKAIQIGSDGGDDKTVTFYYQRPPTLRIQPGPARAYVKAHHDAIYGHQMGEVNFWVPLTDRRLTNVDLHCETSQMEGDYHPMKAQVGEIACFHGSSCRHYVNSNHTENTRVSFDFRVGVEGYFDPHWQMLGTTSDHDRKAVRL